MNGDVLLEVQGVEMRFGGVTALSDVDMRVARGSVHGLIGPNGAGKTTLLNVVCRMIRPQRGRVAYDGRDLLAFPADRLAALGIARTFQNLALVDDASVLDNVLIGMHARIRTGLHDELLFLRRGSRWEHEAASQARSVLDNFDLGEHADTQVNSLSYGQRKLVELARAWAARPTLLLLDEPTAGLNSVEIERLQARLSTLRREHALTMLVITHHIEFLVGMADTITVLDLGRPIAEGPPEQVRANPAVVSAYLGAE